DQSVQDFAAQGTAATATIFYVMTDHLGTPRLITDQSQEAVWRNDNTEPFGDSVPNGDPNNTGTTFDLPLRFPGQNFDQETNTNYNYYRDFDPNLGAYKQSDPIGFRGGLNTYNYVASRPLSFTDRRGLCPFCAGAATAGDAVGGAATAGGAVSS